MIFNWKVCKNCTKIVNDIGMIKEFEIYSLFNSLDINVIFLNDEKFCLESKAEGNVN